MDKAKILVVDDEPSIVKAVRAYLEKEGYTVRITADGAAAIAAARDFRPDLVVLDIMLPSMDGLEVLRHLRRESEVYVLFLTAKSEETGRVVGLTAGADDYLVKPFSGRRAGDGAGLEAGPAGDLRGRGYRHRHRPRTPAPPVRALLPGGPLALPGG